MVMNSSQNADDDRIEKSLDGLLDLGSSVAREPTEAGDAGCPPSTVWQRVATHRLDAAASRVLIEHAAGCHRCGAILNFWGNLLSDEPTPAESSQLAALSVLQPAWQEQMAKTLAAAGGGAGGKAAGGRAVWPGIMAAAGLVAAAALVFLFFGSFHKPASPERLLAEAYVQHRIMDARIPLAGFAPVDAAHHRRAAGAGSMSDSVPLLEARASINQALMKTPEDPHWLLLQARSDLLNENYDSAIDTLKRLHATDPSNVAVLTDLASAYVMRSRATDVATDEATALDYLEQAVRLDPNHSVVLYNQAVVLQDLFQYANAIEAWKKFLAVEPDPAWQADGRRRLAEIEAKQAKIKAQQSRLDPFLSNPEGMLHLARSPAVVAEYDEELSTLYLPQLLKVAFPLPPSANPSASDSTSHSGKCDNACSAARALLNSISVSLEEQHRDPWLVELLAGSTTPGFADGVNLLASAIADGPHISPVYALAEARSARRAFERSGNIAGIARSGVEQVYNLEHLRDPKGCFAVARELSSLLAHHSYPWMDAQFHADAAACNRMENDFGSSSRSLRRAVSVSSNSGYRIVHLRAFGFLASDQQFMGDSDLSWTMNLQVLRDYWNGNYPLVRALQPYANLADDEQASSRFYSATLLRRESADQASLMSNPDIMMQNHLVLANAEVSAGEMREASKDLDLAEAELAQLPGNAALRGTAAEFRLLMAEAYLARNDLPSAAGMLRNEAKIGIGGSELQLRYASAAGHLALLEGRTRDADDDLTRAVTMAELGYRETRGLQNQIDWIEKAREVYAALAVTWLREGKDPADVLAIWERYRILSAGEPLQEWCHGNDLDCLARPLEEARKALKRETILGTIRFDRSLLVWTMDDRGLRIHEAGIDAPRFDLLCHTFFDTLASPTTSEASIRFYGGRLSSVLLTPAAATFDRHRSLIFDLDDSMEFLPASALLLNGSYLGLQFASSTIHSVLLASREPAAAASSLRSLVVGASIPGDPAAPALPEAKTEALAVAELLKRPKVFVGDEAQVSSIEAAAPHAALIHFAGHTKFTREGTHLLLAQPMKSGTDWLDARAFRSHTFANCRLVVLSACSTGKREERRSDDIQDIVQALTAKGAQQIVATHWDVDSAASVALMKAFYSGLANGLAVPQALLAARTAVQSQGEYQHPYYWASYYAIGLNRSNLKELFHHERTGNIPDQLNSRTGSPNRNPF